jgi:hypothetical protein
MLEARHSRGQFWKLQHRSRAQIAKIQKLQARTVSANTPHCEARLLGDG